MEIISLELILENCEVVQAPKESVKYFQVEREIENKERSNTTVRIVLENLHDLKYPMTWMSGCVNPVDRLLSHNDIVEIDIHHINGGEIVLDIDWDNEDCFENENQTTKLINNELHINIK